MFTAYANPTRSHNLLAALRPFFWVAMLACLMAGAYFGLVASPADYQQGEWVRLMYVHVPAAWMSLLMYGTMAACSFTFLVWRHALADIIARESAIATACMALLTLVTGALWGKPTWGTYWVWDARLTSMFILLLMVLGYSLLARQAAFHEARQRACAYLCLFGAINLPIIKFSVEWWNTLHQPASIMRSGGSAIDGSMLMPLMLMFGGYLSAYLLLLSYRIPTVLMQAKVRRLERKLLHMQRKKS